MLHVSLRGPPRVIVSVRAHARRLSHPLASSSFHLFSLVLSAHPRYHLPLDGARTDETRVCTRVELKPLQPPARDDERTPLESFDIGDVGKYNGGRIYRIFFCLQRDGGCEADGKFQPRGDRSRKIVPWMGLVSRRALERTFINAAFKLELGF